MKLWVILKPLATAAKASNAPLATNGRVLIQIPVKLMDLNFLVWGAVLFPVLETVVVINIKNVLVQLIIYGMIRKGVLRIRVRAILLVNMGVGEMMSVVINVKFV